MSAAETSALSEASASSANKRPKLDVAEPRSTPDLVSDSSLSPMASCVGSPPPAMAGDSWEPILNEIRRQLQTDVEFTSPFELCHIAADYQEDQSGSCYAVAPLSLVHAYQGCGVLRTSDATHDAKFIEEELKQKAVTVDPTNHRRGGKPFLAFKIFLGEVTEHALHKSGHATLALDDIAKLGGVYPYVPAPVLFEPPSLPEPKVIIVPRQRLEDAYSTTAWTSSDWHSLFILGVVKAADNQYVLCRNSWINAPQWILLPVLTTSNLKLQDDEVKKLICYFTVSGLEKLEPAEFKGIPICRNPMSLVAIPAAPVSGADLPPTF